MDIDWGFFLFLGLFSLKETISDKSYSAYSCQCKGVSVNKLGTVMDYGMKEWKCIGHYDWIDLVSRIRTKSLSTIEEILFYPFYSVSRGYFS